VIRHQDKRVYSPTGALTGLAQRGQEALSVIVIPKNRFLPIAAIHQMIDGTCKFHASFPRHGCTLSRRFHHRRVQLPRFTD
jgi:hypothetical protein